MSIKNTARRAMLLLMATSSLVNPVFGADQSKPAYDLEIQQQPLLTALKALSGATGLEVIYFTEIAEGVQSAPLAGRYASREEALATMLAGTNLEMVKLKGQEAVSIRPKPEKAQTSNRQNRSGEKAQVTYASYNAAPQAGSSAPTASASNELAFDEIIVTATRRDSTVRDVPYNIQAISAKSIENAGARNMKDFVRMIPGISFTDTGSRDGIRVFLRGLRSGDDYGLIPTTSTYVDDTLIDRPSNFRPIDLKVVDIDRIEVLRGPQGTLYGGGSVGGTLRYISKKPELDTWEGRISGLGSQTEHGGSNYDLSAMVNAPLVDEKVAMRVNAGYFSNSGFVDNIKLGEDDTDWDKTFAGRISLRIKPSDALTVDMTYHHEDAKYGDQSRYDEALGKFNMDLDFLGEKTDTINLANLTVTYDLNFAELVSSTSYIDEAIRSTEDITRFTRDWYAASLLRGTTVPLPLLTGYNEVFADNSSFSQEVRIVSKSESRFDWIVGGYFYDSDINGGYDEFVPRPFANQAEFEDFLGVSLNDDREWRGRYDETYDQWAVFGELGVQITDKWHASVGVRHYDFQRTGTNIQIDQWRGGAVAGRDADGFARLTPAEDEISSGELNENGEVFRFNTSYKVDDNSLVYLTIAEGYRPGGFNVANSATELADEYKQYESDSLVSYELGGKVSLLNNRVYISSAIYYIDWSDMQTQIQLPTLFGKRGNAGKAHSQGFEVEVNARDMLIPGLDFGVSYAYTDAKLDETVNGIGMKGEPVPFVPKSTISTMFDYLKPLDSGWNLGVNFLATYTGSSHTGFGPIMPGYWGDSTNDEYFYLDDYILANLSFRMEKDNWMFRVFANNLFDEDGNTYRSLSRSRSSLRAGSEFVNVTRPRTVGVEVTRRF